jgi:hypothetical protein
VVFFGGLNPACGGINIHKQKLTAVPDIFIFIISDMKNICVIILNDSWLMIANKSTYGPANTHLQTADSFRLNRNRKRAKIIYQKYPGGSI